MDYRFAVIATLLALSGAVHAGYAQLNPPAGWVTGGGGHKPGTFARKLGPVSANDGKWLLKTVVTDATLNVGGRAITVPAALRLAANAGVFASRNIFLNPWVAGGVAVAGWLAQELIRWNEELQRWEVPDENSQQSDGFAWCYNSVTIRDTQDCGYPSVVEVATKSDALDGLLGVCVAEFGVDKCVILDGVVRYNFYGYNTTPDTWHYREVRSKPSNCPAGWYVTPAGCLQHPGYRRIEEPEFTERLTETPMPEQVPNEIPPEWPLPTELPKINPGPSPDYNPRPFFVPQGDPVPNPNYDPNAEPSEENQPYIRPGLNVRPRPTDDAPWNVDIKPIDRPSPNDEPNPDPDMNGEPIPGDKPKEPKDVGLCDMYPDIVACAKLGQVSEVPVKNRTVPLSIQREEGFGPSEGSCPAPSDFVIMGRSMSFRWDLFCEFATGIRPVVVGMAYLLAVLAFFGLSRKGS